jgi:regulator of cell morphogenesis and NO signaling
MIIESTKTVGEIALEQPQATKVFEAMKIDYCCGGKQTLEEACASAGVDVTQLMRTLEQVSQNEAHGDHSLEFQKASLTELIGHILDKHHVYTKEQMVRLEPLIGKVISAHGFNHPELREIGEQFQQLCADLKQHMFKEERILFPYLVELDRSATQNRAAPFAPFGTVNNPIRVMMMEHETAGDLLRGLRTLSSDYSAPPDACISYKTLYAELEALEQDLHQHIHLENNLLFPRATELEVNVGR